jgi:hypothetical protein
MGGRLSALKMRMFEYLNYNDVHKEAVNPNALPHSSRPTSPVTLHSPRTAESLRKIILNYSFLLADRIGKGYSSVVYRGLNDRTGIFPVIQAQK